MTHKSLIKSYGTGLRQNAFLHCGAIGKNCNMKTEELSINVKYGTKTTAVIETVPRS